MRTRADRRRRLAGRSERFVSRAVYSIVERLESRQLLSGVTIYVDQSARGGNNGADWADAFTNLQTALTAAQNYNPSAGYIVTINVAQGTYTPGGSQSSTFQLMSGESLNGGFASGGSATANPAANPTILSGNIGALASYHVVTAISVDDSAVIDGFTITGGDAYEDGSNEDGGGMYLEDASPTVLNCNISGNYAYNGGGIAMFGDSSPTLTDCTISDNAAAHSGGAIDDDGLSPTLTGCTIDGDSANFNGGAMYDYNEASPTLLGCTLNGDTAGNDGGAMFEYYSSTTLTNCTFSGDGATNIGGGLYNYRSAVTLTNCTLAGDSASSYSAIGADIGSYGSTTVANSIIWDNGPDNANEIQQNVTAEYSDIDQSYNEMPYPGTGNIFGNPFFVRSPGTDGSSDYGNLELQSDSYAIDQGDVALLPLNVTTDLAGNPRFENGHADMGAYEYIPPGPLPDLEAVNVSTSSPSVNFGGTISFYWTDQNIGNATAAGGYYDDLYLSSSPQLDNSATLLFPISPSQPIPASTSVNFGITFSIPAETRSFEPGTYYLIVRTNATWADSESNDSNNDASTAIQITSVPQTIYVDADTPASTGDQNGTSWADAVPTLQQGLNLAFPGDTILVAQGTYFPTNTNDQTLSFQLTEGVTLQGGYGGNELKLAGGNPNTRNVLTYTTVLSGLIAGASNPSMASYNVLTATDVDSTTDLDGFTITGAYGYDSAFGGGGIYLGQASPTINDCTFTGNFATSGGGLDCNDFSSPTITNCTFTNNDASQGGGVACIEYSSPTITNCSFTGNQGSAMYNDGDADPTLTNCTFTSNTGGLGGAVSDYQASPTFIYCTFTGNSAVAGGAIYDGGIPSNGSSPTMIDCRIINNTASDEGGGIYDYSSSPTIINCLLSGDGANEGGGIYNYQSNAGAATEIINCTIADDTGRASAYGAIATNTSPMTIANTIIYGDGPDELGVTDATATYSDIQGGFAGKGNINADAVFVNPSAGNFQLQATSPCINTGSNADVPAGITADLAGNPRILDGTVDMGAYEFQGSTGVTWTGNADGTHWNVAGNWSDNAVPTSTTAITIPTGDTPQIVSGTYAVASLTLVGTAKVDLGKGTLMIDYGSGADPISTIQSELTTGYNSGAWNGSGIISSTVANTNKTSSLKYAVGYIDGAKPPVNYAANTVSSGQIEIMPTLAGDATLSGTVDFYDFQVVLSNFGKASQSWDQGDFDYTGTVDFYDFQVVLSNFGQNSSAVTQAPAFGNATAEPTDTQIAVLSGGANDTILGGQSDALALPTAWGLG